MDSNGQLDQDTTDSVRASVTFPGHDYRILESIARDKKVSLAWVVRDAVDRYISDQWPLLDASTREQRR